MRAFDQRHDLATINDWMKGHEKRTLFEDEIPIVGFIVDGVAIGFLYQTDSSLGLLENFVSNPNASPRDVARAFDDIVSALKKEAANHGIARLVVFSKVRSIGKRIVRMGFELKGDWKAYSAEIRPTFF